MQLEGFFKELTEKFMNKALENVWANLRSSYSGDRQINTWKILTDNEEECFEYFTGFICWKIHEYITSERLSKFEEVSGEIHSNF